MEFVVGCITFNGSEPRKRHLGWNANNNGNTTFSIRARVHHGEWVTIVPLKFYQDFARHTIRRFSWILFSKYKLMCHISKESEAWWPLMTTIQHSIWFTWVRRSAPMYRLSWKYLIYSILYGRVTFSFQVWTVGKTPLQVYWYKDTNTVSNSNTWCLPKSYEAQIYQFGSAKLLQLLSIGCKYFLSSILRDRAWFCKVSGTESIIYLYIYHITLEHAWFILLIQFMNGERARVLMGSTSRISMENLLDFFLTYNSIYFGMVSLAAVLNNSTNSILPDVFVYVTLDTNIFYQ